MSMESGLYRYDRSAAWMASLIELPGAVLLLLLKTISLVFALPLFIVSAGRRRFVEKLCRWLAFPVF